MTELEERRHWNRRNRHYSAPAQVVVDRAQVVVDRAQVVVDRAQVVVDRAQVVVDGESSPPSSPLSSPPSSPLPVLEPCPIVAEWPLLDDTDIPTVESIEQRFEDGLIYLDNNPVALDFINHSLLPSSIADMVRSDLPEYIQLKNDLGLKNEYPYDFAMYISTLQSRLYRRNFEIAEHEYRKYMALEQLEANPQLEAFVRDFADPRGFSWSADPRIDELYNNLGRETDSPCSFALYLRELQAVLKEKYKTKNVHVNRCIECKVDMGECNPRQYCGKIECVGLGY
jgi:hypothetical protein